MKDGFSASRIGPGSGETRPARAALASRAARTPPGSRRAELAQASLLQGRPPRSAPAGAAGRADMRSSSARCA